MSDLSAIQRAKEQLRADEAAEIADAFHEGFGAGIGHVEDAMAERVAAAEARGYDRAIANLRDDQMYLAWLRILGAGVMPLTQLTPKARLADYLEAVKESTR